MARSDFSGVAAAARSLISMVSKVASDQSGILASPVMVSRNHIPAAGITTVSGGVSHAVFMLLIAALAIV